MDVPCLDISQLIPHRGAMCLLDSIETWDDHHIVCRATSHRRPDNPLRDDSGLRALCGIEYGAQAIAAHAALLGGPQWAVALMRDCWPPRGMSPRRCPIWTMCAGALTIRANLVLTHEKGSIYDVMVTGDGRTLLTGRLSVMVSIDNPHMARPVSDGRTRMRSARS